VSSLRGLGVLVRLVLRLDRVRLPVWLVSLGGTAVVSAASLRPLYPDQRSIDEYARLFGQNPAVVAFAGPGYGFDDPNLGVVLVNEVQLWACVGAALMSAFLVNHHTRQEEDDERAELLRASTTGRHAPMAAAVLVVSAANVVLGAVLAAAFAVLGYEVVGSVALGASIAGCGLVAAAVAALTAQVAGSGRGALGASTTLVGLAFAVRAAGDVADHWVRWLSPIGMAQGVRAYADERWWPLAALAAVTLAIFALAAWAAARRDLGVGLVPRRPGRHRAPSWMVGAEALAFRLQRWPLVAWAVGVALLGVVYGSLGEEVEAMVEETPAYADLVAPLEGVDLTDAFLTTATSQLALLGTGYALSAVLRARTEEAAGRAEVLLALPVSRTRWLGSHVLVAATGTVVVVAAGGLGTGVSFAIVTGDVGAVPRLVVAALATVPAVAVLVGLAVGLFGLSARAAPAAWAAYAACVVLELFGELLRLPDVVRDLSPFRHAGGLPAGDLQVLPLAVLVAVAAASIGAGAWAAGRRDLRSG